MKESYSLQRSVSRLDVAAQTYYKICIHCGHAHCRRLRHNDDLVQCINDINKLQKELQFVIFAGDITEFEAMKRFSCQRTYRQTEFSLL